MNLSKEQEYAIAFKVLDELKSTPTNMGTPFERAIDYIPLIQGELLRKFCKKKLINLDNF